MKTPQSTVGASLAGAKLAGASALATAGAVIAVPVLAVLAVLAVPAAAGAPLPAAAAAAAGANVYKSQCVGCHGPDGSASTPIGKALKVQDLRRPEVQAMKDADLAAVIEKGKGKMPSFKGKLNATQIGQVVEYIRTLVKAKQAG